MAGSLEPFDVLIVWSYKNNVGLRIPQTLAAPFAVEEGAGGNPNSNSTKPNKGRDKKDGEWNVRLVAESGRLKDKGNVLGQLHQSHDGRDGHDLEELAPLAPPYLTITFDNPAFEAVPWGHTTDFRGVTDSVQGEWLFTVRGLGISEEVTLRWQGEPALFENAQLIDEKTGEVVEASPGGNYTFRMDGSGVNHFRWVMD